MLTILVGLLSQLYAEDKRSIPLDMYLIIDGSSSFQNSKNEAVSWINSQVVDLILMEGDNITIWNAGDSSNLIYSGAVPPSGQKGDIKNTLQALTVNGKRADFSGALRDATSRASRAAQGRLTYTMLITASAGGLENAVAGNLLKWFRSEKYERWQALIVAPDFAQKVKSAASGYMSSQR